jgi:hypothetical protein
MIEAWGRGIERIMQECVTAGVRELAAGRFKKNKGRRLCRTDS